MKGLKSFLKFILFLGIGLLILYLLYTNLDAAYQKECVVKGIPADQCSFKDKLINDFKSVKIFWILLVCVIFMFSNLCRALRWNQFLATLGHRPKIINSLGAVMIAYVTNLAIPRLGEIVRAGTLKKYEDIPLEHSVGTIVLDRLLDVISLLIAIGLAFLLSFNTFQTYIEQEGGLSPNTLYILLFLGLAGLVSLFFFDRFIRATESDNKLIIKLKSLWSGFREGILSIKKVKNIPLLLFYSVSIWVSYYLMTYLCFFAFVPTENLSALAGLVVFVFGSLGIVFPAPGGMGSYQWLVSQALIIYGINEFDAFSFSNIIFLSINIICNVLFGFLFLLVLPIYNSKN